MFTASELQHRAMNEIKDWYLNSKKPYFTLFGFAGSGKSTIIKPLTHDLGLDPDNPKDVLYASFMGKAVDVMRKKGLKNCFTIHSLIYVPVEHSDHTVTFELNELSILKNTKLLVLDEVSMVNEDLAKDLLSFGIKVIALGDPCQLPPIEGQGFFNRDPDFFLDEIHRQALNSPIIALATIVREHHELPNEADFGDVQIIPYKKFDLMSQFNYSQVITGKNVTRKIMNLLYKERMGVQDCYPNAPGLKVICLKNNKELQLFNGMTGETTSGVHLIDEKLLRFKQSIQMESGKLYKNLDICTIPYREYFDNNIQLTQRDKFYLKDTQQFDLAHCITGYKSQGNQYQSVLLLDDGFGYWDKIIRAKYLYTVITRAIETFTLVQGVRIT